MKYGETRVIAVLGLLIIRCTAEKRGIFHIHSLVVNLDIKFIHKVNLSHEFNKFGSHQQLNFIEAVLNENCFKSFIVKVVMLDNNAQKFSTVFLKMVIFLLAGLQFKLNFYD